MEGLCKNCGQMHLVSAETQEEADRIASESCDNAKFSAANSEIKINGVAGKVDIKRTKKQTNQMTI
jgi:hypothetical protein|nr:MAG TPA: hypothetical protein [Caudoviricetes sp.]